MIRFAFLLSLLLSFTLSVGERCHVCGHLSGDTHATIAEAECEDDCSGHSHASDHEHIFSTVRLSERVQIPQPPAAPAPLPPAMLEFDAAELHAVSQIFRNHDPCSPLLSRNPVLRC